MTDMKIVFGREDEVNSSSHQEQRLWRIIQSVQFMTNNTAEMIPPHSEVKITSRAFITVQCTQDLEDVQSTRQYEYM